MDRITERRALVEVWAAAEEQAFAARQALAAFDDEHGRPSLTELLTAAEREQAQRWPGQTHMLEHVVIDRATRQVLEAIHWQRATPEMIRAMSSGARADAIDRVWAGGWTGFLRHLRSWGALPIEVG